MITNRDAAAYPHTTVTPSDDGWQKEITHHRGLTKRELFAAVALQGILSHSSAATHMDPQQVAQTAKACADHLIRELNG